MTETDSNMLEMILDPDQVERYVRDGFLVVEGLVSSNELEELKSEAVNIAKGVYPCGGWEPLPNRTPDSELLESFLCVHQPHHVSPVIESYVRLPAICSVLSQIVGAHLAHWTGNVKCMQSMYFVKPAGLPGQAWHQDEIYIPTRDRSLTGAWIAIDDATVENGCLWVLPGSHQRGVLYKQRDHGNPDEFDPSLESFGFDDSGEVPVEVAAGSVVFFNGYLLHRSKSNRSVLYRRALVSHYMSAESYLPWGQSKEDIPIAQMDDRHVIFVAGNDPYPEEELLKRNDTHMRMHQKLQS